MLTPEDELDVLDQDLGTARRQLWSLERAPLEGRWTGTAEAWERAMHFARLKVLDLRERRAAAYAELHADDEVAA